MGYGIIHAVGSKREFTSAGVIRVADYLMPDRLKCIYESLASIIENHCPTVMAVEQVFMAKNPSAAIKLGQARGVAIAAGAVAGLKVHEYSARQIKQAVVGIGAADKHQVQHMVKILLRLSATPQEDAADALAAALCHANTEQSMVQLSGSRRYRRLRVS